MRDSTGWPVPMCSPGRWRSLDLFIAAAWTVCWPARLLKTA